MLPSLSPESRSEDPAASPTSTVQDDVADVPVIVSTTSTARPPRRPAPRCRPQVPRARRTAARTCTKRDRMCSRRRTIAGSESVGITTARRNGRCEELPTSWTDRARSGSPRPADRDRVRRDAHPGRAGTRKSEAHRAPGFTFADEPRNLNRAMSAGGRRAGLPRQSSRRRVETRIDGRQHGVWRPLLRHQRARCPWLAAAVENPRHGGSGSNLRPGLAGRRRDRLRHGTRRRPEAPRPVVPRHLADVMMQQHVRGARRSNPEVECR